MLYEVITIKAGIPKAVDGYGVNMVCSSGMLSVMNAATIGESTPIGLARGLNAQWTQGGLMYAPPFR